ncbi:MAG: dynamin family protein [Acidimicrobiales bacterium]|nr:dynamin family protein [Acidimicrobiales bacterium]
MTQASVGSAKLGATTDRGIEMARDLVAKALGPDERAAFDTLLDDVAAAPAEAVVVVVGETKRGKSTLVNALLGRPGLSPVAGELATATYVLFTRGDECVVVPAVSGGDVTRVPLEQLERWVSVDGAADNPEVPRDERGLPAPSPIRVEVPSPLLATLSLIDTPGVGGLLGEHLETTLAAVRLADAVLFVTDVTAQITEPEAQFLTHVVGDRAEVVVALNMVDKLPPGDAADRAVAAARQRLVERVPHLEHAPVVAVSGRRACDALASTVLGERERELLRDLSGMAALEDVLREQVADRCALRVHDLRLRAVASVAEGVAGIVAQRVMALEAVRARTPEEISDESVALRRRREHIVSQMPHEIRAVRQALALHVDTQIREIRRAGDAAVAKAVTPAELGGTVELALDSLAGEVSQLLGAKLADAMRSCLGAVADDPLFVAAMARVDAQATAEVELRDMVDVHSPELGPDAFVQLPMSLVGGSGLARLLATFAVGATSPLLGPIAVVGALGMLSANVFLRRRMLRTTEGRAWLVQRLDMATRDLGQHLDTRCAEAQRLVNLALSEWLGLREDELRAEQRSLKSTGAERQKELAELQALATRADKIARSARQVLARVEQLALAAGSRP